jgi:hypothetical protein
MNAKSARRASTRKSTIAKPARAGDEAPDGVAIEEAEVELLDVAEDLAPQIAHGVLAGVRHHQHVDELESGPHRHDHQIQSAQPQKRRNALGRLEQPAREAGDTAVFGGAIAHHPVEPGLDDPGGRRVEHEERPHQQQGGGDQGPVGGDVAPEPTQQACVVGLAEGLFLVHRLPSAGAQRFGGRAPVAAAAGGTHALASTPA